MEKRSFLTDTRNLCLRQEFPCYRDTMVPDYSGIVYTHQNRRSHSIVYSTAKSKLASSVPLKLTIRLFYETSLSRSVALTLNGKERTRWNRCKRQRIPTTPDQNRLFRQRNHSGVPQGSLLFIVSHSKILLCRVPNRTRQQPRFGKLSTKTRHYSINLSVPLDLDTKLEFSDIAIIHPLLESRETFMVYHKAHYYSPYAIRNNFPVEFGQNKME